MPILRVVLVVLSAVFYASAASNECLFEGCICDYFNGDESIGLNIVCAYSDITKPRPKNYFPRRLGNEFVINSVRKNVNDVTVKSLTVTAYDFQTLPDDIFYNMSMAELHLINNNFESLTRNAFRGVRALKFIDIDDSRFKQIEPGTLTTLNTLSGALLSNCDMSNGRFEALVGELRDVYTLILRNNQLKSFNPEWLASLKSLTQLSIDSNGLVDFQAKTFKENTKLSIVTLVYNELANVSVVLNALEPISANIYELNLDSNKMTELKEFANFVRLNRLIISRNQLQNVDKNVFAQLINLNLLDLSYNQISSVDSSNFQNIKNIRELLLNDNKLTSVPSIKGLVNLKKIDMSNQNGALVRVDDFAFERTTAPNEMLRAELDENPGTQFGSQAFCSHAYTESKLNSLAISYNSLGLFNKCLLKQMQTGAFLEIMTASPNPANCNCDLKLFAEKFSVNISGICSSAFKTLVCDPSTYVDTCLAQPQYVCGYLPPSTTTVNTATSTVPGGSTGTVSGANSDSTSTVPTATSTNTASGTESTMTTASGATQSVTTSGSITNTATSAGSDTPSSTVSAQTSILTAIFSSSATRQTDVTSSSAQSASTQTQPTIVTSTTSGCTSCAALNGVHPLVYIGSFFLLASFLSLPYIYRKM